MAEEKKTKKQGRPQVWATPLHPVSVGLTLGDLAKATDLALDAVQSDGSRWPEFNREGLPVPPSRSGIIRLATVIGLRMLEDRATATGPATDYSDLIKRERIKPAPKPKPEKAKAKDKTKDSLKADETRALIAVLTKLAERLG